MPLRQSKKTDAMTGLGTVSICFGGLRRPRRPCRAQERRPMAPAPGRLARWARKYWPRKPAAVAAATEQLARAADERDWSGLPEDLLLMAMESMEVLDVVQSGAVCSSWSAAYAQFLRLRLPARPNPPPCLLHTRAADSAPAIYCPSTGATFPCGAGIGAGFVVAGSARGWVFAADEATADPFLLNPLTGARAMLPPLATLERVKGSFLDADGTVTYNVDRRRVATADVAVKPIKARRARAWMYRRVAFSADIVLLVHMPHGEVSYARPGDERWTSLSSVLRSFFFSPIIGAVHSNDTDNLFFLMCQGGSIFSVDLSGPVPVGRPVSYMMRELFPSHKHTYYLVFRGSELLLVTRDLLLRRPREGEKDVSTTGIWIKKVGSDLPAPGWLPGIGDDYALFLGNNQPMCLPVKDYPMLRRNCAYLADDSEQYFLPITRRDVGIWDFGSSTMEKFGGDLQPWMDEQPPIWITPSLY